MAVSLRTYREADLPALHALDQVCFAQGIAYSYAELRSFLDHPSAFTAVAVENEAVEDETILGFAIVRPMRRKPAGAWMVARSEAALHLLTIDVAPAARRRGVGSSLMRWVHAKAGELGSRVILLEVAVDNLSARRFYAALGFVEHGTIPGYYNGVTDALRMELSLTGRPANGKKTAVALP